MNNSLTNQFNSVLSQYQETYQKYLNSLNDINSNSNLITLENNALFGGNTMSKNKLDNLDSCTTACISDASCNGANFNTINNMCSLIQSAESIIPANKTTSIVNPSLYYSYQLQKLNDQLTSINQQIISFVNQQENSAKIAKQKEIIIKNSNVLNEEREKIKQMTYEINTINSANVNSSLTVSMYYYRYLILIFIVGLLAFILISFSSSQQRGGGHRYIKDCLFLLLIIMSCLGISQKYS
jgi:lipopolysaccharide export LptBFGC system permease protein LptF